MSAEKKQDDLKSFEAALAALVPRTDRLDRDRLMFLAGQQSALPSPDQPTMLHIVPVGAQRGAGNTILPSPIGRWAGGEGFGIGTLMVSGGEGKMRLWAWPVAFTAMTTAAAIMLIMLVYRQESGAVNEIVKQQATPTTSQANDANAWPNTSNLSDLSSINRTALSLAFLSETDNGKFNETVSPYANSILLRQLLANGIDSGKPKSRGSVNIKTFDARPLTNRELLNQYIEQSETYLAPGEYTGG